MRVYNNESSWGTNDYWIKELKSNGNYAIRPGAVYDGEKWVTFNTLGSVIEPIRRGTSFGDFDIAIRRMSLESNKPDRLYSAYVEGSVIKVCHREFPDTKDDYWTSDFTLGTGSDVSVVFDGTFKWSQTEWRFQTEEYPWFFWVDDSNNLYGQHWNDASTKKLIDINVKKVSSIRGWSSRTIRENDQGLLVAYVKIDNTLWYRSKCIQIDNSYLWESSTQVIEVLGNINNISLFITLDYRIGFIIENSNNEIYWLITVQNWAGLAISSHNINVQSKISSADFISIQYKEQDTLEQINVSMNNLNLNLLYASTENSFINVSNIEQGVSGDYGRVIVFNLAHPSKDFTSGDVIVKDVVKNTIIIFDTIESLGGGKYKIEITNIEDEAGFNNATGDISILIPTLRNDMNIVFNPFEIQFTPTNLVPVFIPLPVVEEV